MEIYTIQNKNGLCARILSRGATIQSLLVPDRDGKLRDIVLGYDTEEEYRAGTCYFGAVIGRNANRIAAGRVPIDGKIWQMPLRDRGNSLHSSPNGADTRLFVADPQEDPASLTLRVLLEDGGAGLPGNLLFMVTYRLTEDNALEVLYEAVSDRKTIVNPTSHAYFNLEGEGNGTVEGHRITIFADRYCPIGEDGLPLAREAEVAGNAFDFRVGQTIAAAFEEAGAETAEPAGAEAAGEVSAEAELAGTEAVGEAMAEAAESAGSETAGEVSAEAAEPSSAGDLARASAEAAEPSSAGDLARASAEAAEPSSAGKTGEAFRQLQLGSGFDHHFPILGKVGELRPFGRAVAPKSGIGMEFWSDRPGMQFYTGNFIGEQTGKGGKAYHNGSGFCFEPQAMPDAPNRFPEGDAQCTVWPAGKVFQSVSRYRFFVEES